MKRLLVASLFAFTFAAEASAQGSCFPACRPGYVCASTNECVSICNPPCGEGQICTAEARCIDDPSARVPAPPAAPIAPPPTSAPQATPPPSTYPAPPPPTSAPQATPPPSTYPAPTPYADPQIRLPRRTSQGGGRLVLTFDPGFGGSSKASADGFTSSSADLDTTFGARVLGQYTVWSDHHQGRQYSFYLGGQFGIDGYLADGAPSDADRLIILGFEGAFGFRYAIDLGSVALEPSVGATVGLALGTANDAELEDTEFGVSIGLRAGATLWVTPSVGVHANLGYQAHLLFLEVSGIDVRLRLHQMRLGLGIAFRFGA